VSRLRLMPLWSQTVSLSEELRLWAVDYGYPIWSRLGIDDDQGGFFEKIDLQGRAVQLPRRGRVTPRQIYSFAAAKELGWILDRDSLLQDSVETFLARFIRPDGLIRTLVDAAGAVLDDSVSLYDQAFGLFALASVTRTQPQILGLEPRAKHLLEQLKTRQANRLGGFDGTTPRSLPLQSNPHMHIFEAALAWTEVSDDPIWQAQADEIAELCLSKFIEPQLGCVLEYFDGDWSASAGVEGLKFEPGHQFEWSWLLLRWGKAKARPDAIAAARKMIALAETHGIDPVRGVAYNVLLSDLSVHDAQSRLWPQTERIKAGILLAQMTGDPNALRGVVEGGLGLLKYLDVQIKGLWHDRMQPDGSFIDEPAPASSFYHIICAIVELQRAVQAED
jgi:mannose/cellobiose epimerase-like protein (N-acyl-D-glucosamine 2-epimerase family)